MNELSLGEIKRIFNEMGEEIAAHGSIISFVQLRLSAEHFIVPLCGFATERILNQLKPDTFRVFFEKKAAGSQRGPVDLIIKPKGESNNEWDDSYLFEFKMAWKGGLGENIGGIKGDLKKLNWSKKGFAIGILFAFNGGPSWAPYSHKYEIGDLSKLIIDEIGDPIYIGKIHTIKSSEITGKFQLLAWKSEMCDVK